MKVLFLDTAHPSLQNILEKNGFVCEQDLLSDPRQLQKKINAYQGVILRSRISIDRSLMDAMLDTAEHHHPESSTLRKFIGRIGSGMEHIDTKYAEQKGIVCLSSPEGNREAVAEHALGLLLSLMNRITVADREVRNGLWSREPNRGTELRGKTIGIYGYGNTGSAFARLFQGFGVNLLAYDKYQKGFSSEHVIESTPEEIFEKADVLSLHVPLDDHTKYMADENFFSRFRKPIYFLNTSRGPVVRTDALVSAIRAGKVLGAGLDVIEYEETSFEKLDPKAWEKDPAKADSWLFLKESDRVILTPHIAGWSFQSLEKLAVVLAEKIVRLYH